jgi:SAM-dependent methyltransferase
MVNKSGNCCPVCKNKESVFYLSTNALMHKPNNEIYIFNKCSTCETVFLTNPVASEKLPLYYTDNYLPYRGSSAWGKYTLFVDYSEKALNLKRVNFVKKNLKTNKGEVCILDVGCGNPSFLNLLQQKLNVNCTGIDFSDSSWYGKEYANLELIKTTTKNFIPNKLYDIITLWHYLEHDYNPSQTIEALHKYLKPEGKIIIEIPDYGSLSAKTQRAHWQGWHSPRHISLFSMQSFMHLFTTSKWKINSHLRYGTLNPFTLWWLGKMEKKGINWSGSMENNFWALLFLKTVTYPVFMFEKWLPLGVQILVAEKK